jgi:hypothetical protein
VATPHSAIAAWLEGRPIKAVNAALDGRWLLSLENIVGFDDDVDLEVRSNFGERVHTDAQLQRPVLIELPARPRLLEPRAGEILTTSRPLMIGLAQPMTDVAILINRQVVAQVQADLEGSWNYRVVDPLPNGAVTLAVGCMADTFPEQQATPIVVVVMPNSKFLAARSPLSLTQKPPVKLYYSAPTSP